MSAKACCDAPLSPLISDSRGPRSVERPEIGEDNPLTGHTARLLLRTQQEDDYVAMVPKPDASEYAAKPRMGKMFLR